MLRIIALGGISAASLCLPACNQGNTGSESTKSQTSAIREIELPGIEGISTTRHRFANWQGEWLGPEGMFVIITPVEPGLYQLQMQSGLDMLGTYIGEDDVQGIRFTRSGEQFILRAATGPETGMKWLEQSKSCLMVRQGEGYCRD